MKKTLPMKDVLYIVVHCTATRLSQHVTIDDIDRWHKARGFAQIGYHWYIDREGTIHEGRSEKLAGAHVRHYNQHAIGICYEGGLDKDGRPKDTRTPEQKAALWFLLEDLKKDYPKAKIVGHRDFPHVAKQCPCFDVQQEFSSLNTSLNASLNATPNAPQNP